MNRNRHYGIRGSTLLELLICTGIASVVATGVVITFGHLSAATLRLKTFHQDAYGLSSTLALLQEGMRNQDAHTLPLVPRIHRRTITFFPPALSSLTIDKRDDESNAITFFEVVPKANLLVRKWLSSESIEICNNSPFSWQLIRTAIAVAPDSFSEIIITETIPTSEYCHIVNFNTPELSLIAPQKLRSKPIKIIPLRRIYTLYRATSGALRYLSHVGPKIIENQPLTHRSPVLRLDLKNDDTENRYGLHIEYKTAQRTPSKTIQFFTHVPRLSLSNNALNGF
jgi:hypothetical protein